MEIKPQTTVSALNTAVSAVKESEQKFNVAAQKTVEAYRQASNAVSGGTTNSVDNETIQETNQFSDPVVSIIDMKTAEIAYKANLKVLEEVDEMGSNLIDIMR